MSDHVDETGKPCTRHDRPSAEGLLALALLGSRMPSFHHDAASKLQSLMMALDEIEELPEGNASLRQATATAMNSLRELNQLIAANRSLAKGPQRGRTPVSEVVTRAADRSGVHVGGELPPIEVEISLPAIVHAVALLLDLVAGPTSFGRVVSVTSSVDGRHLALELVGPPGATKTLPPNGNEMIAIASFALKREDGELRCGIDRFGVKLPIAK